MANHDPVAFEAAARAVGFLGFGFYPLSGFIHVDLGPARKWGERFPVRERAFTTEGPMTRNDGCSRRRRVAVGLATILLTGCATVGSDAVGLGMCSPVLEYSREFQVQAAEELALLTEGSAIAEVLSDYAVVREQLRVRSTGTLNMRR